MNFPFNFNNNDMPFGISNAKKAELDQVQQDILDIINNIDTDLEGSNFLLVKGSGTDIENAIELQEVYDTAKTMNPHAANRITIIVAPGYYNFGSNIFEVNTQYIDIVSLDGNKSILFNATPNINLVLGSVNVSANNVFINGINTFTKSFNISVNNATDLTIKNCQGGNMSFGTTQIITGTFINCIGGNNSFVTSGGANGNFIDCTAGNDSFAFDGDANGKFIRCIGGDNTFGGNCNGTFIDCEGGSFSFGNGGTSNGMFKRCKGGYRSFGRSGIMAGTLIECEGGGQAFCSVGTLSGTVINCISGSDSFGASGTLSGKLLYCILTSGTFPTVSSGGRTYYCVDGNGDVNNQ